jgi:hypothetical protein
MFTNKTYPMAVLDDNEINFTGRLGKLTAYRMQGSDKIILRSKGGPTRKQVRKSPKFEHTRLNNSEFAGAIEAVKGIRDALTLTIRRLANFNFTPQLTRICCTMQDLEQLSDKGMRGVQISLHRDLLQGFRLNKKHFFTNVVINSISVTIDRGSKSAVVQLPRLIAGINFSLPWRQPVYRFCVSLGVVKDIMHDGDDHKTLQSGYQKFERLPSTSAETEWYIHGAPFPPQTFELKLDMPEALEDTHTMIVAIGIEMGAPDAHGEIDTVKYAGSACILALG